MAQVSVFSPWKDASRQIAGSDLSVLYYAKAVGDLGAAGTELDQATIQSAAAASTFRYAEGGGALAVDTDQGFVELTEDQAFGVVLGYRGVDRVNAFGDRQVDRSVPFRGRR